MQDIIIHLKAGDVAAEIVDEYNQAVKTVPAITRGLRVNLRLRLIALDGSPFTTDILDFASWDFLLANDWNTTTAPQIRVQSGITIESVTVGEKTYAEIHIPLTETNTEELITALGDNPSVKLGAELAGFEAGESSPGFLIQFDLTVRNRRGAAGTGTPVPVGDGNYSSAQVDALLVTKAAVNHNHDGIYSLVNHNHDGVYAVVNHNHDGIYALVNHTHDYSGIYAAIDHNHNGVYSLIDHTHDYSGVYASINHNHDGVYALVDHNHDGVYASVNHTHDYSGIYASIDHNHNGVYSLIDHTHDYSGVYASVNHNHDGSYAALSHDHGVICAAGSGVTVGKLVYLNVVSGQLTCVLAANTGTEKHYADGYVASINAGLALVKTSGLLEVTANLTPEADLFLGIDGNLAESPPTESGCLVQKTGRAVSANKVFFNIADGREII